VTFVDSETLTIDEAASRGRDLFVEAAHGHVFLIQDKEHGTSAALISTEAITELREDLHDALLVLTREISSTGQRHTLDEVIKELGHSRDDLEALVDED
jgi:hypothetical protein